MKEFWQRQGEKPLFENLLWSKPENKLHAGKLLIIGGNEHNFSAPGVAYEAAVEAGIGVARVLLPDALQKTIGSVLENGEFAPTNKSGSFARNALDTWLEHANWADAVLIAGDIGRNSETTIVIEEFLHKYSGPLIITEDALDPFIAWPDKLFARNKTLIVAAFGQLQKMWPRLVMNNHMIKYAHGLAKNVELIHEFTQQAPSYIITKHNDDVIVCVEGKISTTHNTDAIWRTKLAAQASVWWIQNPSKPFEALTTSVYKQQNLT
jgi:NAD(P)H-hydrate repair Nnr-like enzyme with NAD(P)H-hydrate dehydratase domain